MSASAFDIFAPFFERPWRIAFGLFFGLAAGISYLVYAEETFESSTEVLVIQKDSRLISSPTQQAELGVETSIRSEILGTHLKIITSPRVVQDAVEAGQLLAMSELHRKAMQPSLSKRVKDQGRRWCEAVFGASPDWWPRSEKTSPDSAVVEYILRNLAVRRGGVDESREAQVLQVAFRHTSAEESAVVLEAVVESYRQFLMTMTQRMGEEAKTALQRANEEVQLEVTENEQKYQAFLRRSPLLWRDGQVVNPHEVQLTALEDEMSELRLRKATLESRLQSVRTSLGGVTDAAAGLELLALIEQSDLERLLLLLQVENGGAPVSASGEFEKLLELKLELERKTVRLGANHPDVLNTEQLIDELERYMLENSRSLESIREDDGVNPRRLVGAYEKLLQHDLADSKSREQELTVLIAQHHQRAKQLASDEMRYESLSSSLAHSRQTYEKSIDRMRQIDVSKNVGAFATERLADVVEGEKVWPKAAFVIALGGMLGLCLGGVSAVVADLRDQSFRSATDVEAELELPILTQVHRVKFRRRHVARGSTLDRSLAVLHLPTSGFAESFRGLRTALTYRTRESDGNVLQLTSGVAGEGKSTIASNLAISLAMANKRVLLVDCDLRRRSIHRLFGVTDEVGVSSVLAGTQTIEESLIPSPVRNLTLLTSGPPKANPAELLASPMLGQMTAILRSEYDYVIIDSPPVMGLSDSLAISGIVDYTLLAIRLKKDSRFITRKALDELSRNGANLMGLIINDELGELTYYPRAYASDFRLVGRGSNGIDPSTARAMHGTGNLDPSEKGPPPAHSAT